MSREMSIGWKEVGALIESSGLAHVATSTAGGDPHVAVVFVVCEGDRLTLTMRVSSKKAANLRANPRMAMMWQGNGAETYVWGSVSLVDDPSEKNRVWNGGLFPFDLGQFYGSEQSSDWIVAHVQPVRAVVMAQTERGLERREWTLGA